MQSGWRVNNPLLPLPPSFPLFLLSFPSILFFLQRAAGELDEEALRLTREVLSQNPDITTLWNYRKEILRAKLTPDL